MIRAAIVGIGWWGRILVNAVQGKSAAIRFTAGYTRTRATAEDFCAEHSIALANDFLITHYPQPSSIWYKTGTYGGFCGFERWRATRCNFKRGSARPSLRFVSEQRISAGRR